MTSSISIVETYSFSILDNSSGTGSSAKGALDFDLFFNVADSDFATGTSIVFKDEHSVDTFSTRASSAGVCSNGGG